MSAVSLSIPTPARIPVRVRARECIVTVADHIHRGADLEAQRAGLTVSRHGLTGRSYRSPLFDLIGGDR